MICMTHLENISSNFFSPHKPTRRMNVCNLDLANFFAQNLDSILDCQLG